MSEFGASVYSSFESMSATLAPEHWGVHGGAPKDTCDTGGGYHHCEGGNAMAQRNYASGHFHFHKIRVWTWTSKAGCCSSRYTRPAQVRQLYR